MDYFLSYRYVSVFQPKVSQIETIRRNSKFNCLLYFIELCNLSTPGAVKFTLSLEFEQSDEICGLLKELVDVLITRKCSEEGLEDITHTLIMLSQRLGSSVRQSVGQMLLDGIHHLATEVSTQIESLMREAASYNTIKSREKTEEVDDNNEGSVESSSKGIIADRYVQA